MLLLVTDDAAVTQTFTRILPNGRACVSVATCREARDHLLSAESRFSGFVFDVKLSDGEGVDLLRLARERWPSAAALLLTTCFEPQVINAAYALGCACVLKPFSPEGLGRFVAEFLAADLQLEDGTRRRVAAFAAKHRLTVAATEILVAKIAGYTTEEVLLLRKVGMNTYKTHVKQILRRTGLESLEEVRCAVLRPGTARRHADRV